MMFEICVSALILFAIGYWAALFIMGRREDVLHGQFVEADPELVSAGAGASVAFPQRMSPPVKKATPAPPAVSAPVVSAPAEPMEQQAAAPFEPPPTPEPETAPAPAAATSPDVDAWESLLASLKLELKSASQT
jgi:hypothetical protein